jgi:glycosyltransferase involved in cell wall biosynthesis
MSERPPAPDLSLVIPVYNEEGNVGPLHVELTHVARTLGRSYEIVFVNDGSTDGTLSRLQELRRIDPHLRVVELDGNFGEAAALCAGFAESRGAVVVTLDGDGQNDPGAIPALLDRLGPDVDVVSGLRRERKEAFASRVLPSRIANWLIARTTGVPVHDCGCGLKAYRREVVADAQLPRGMNRFLPAILGVPATRVAEVWVSDRPRGSGRSHYGLSRTFVVLRDLLSLRLLVLSAARRLPLRPALGGAQLATAIVLVGMVLAGLGAPGGAVGTLLLGAAALLAAGVGWAIIHNLRRWVRAQEEGVFRVRRVL